MNTLKDAIDDLLNNSQLSTTEALNKHFAPNFRQRVNGQWVDRATFADQIARLRKIVQSTQVMVLDEIATKHRYAEHHLIELLMHDGGRSSHEVMVFGELGPDGRFVRLEEATVALN